MTQVPAGATLVCGVQVVAVGFNTASSTVIAVTGAAGSHTCHAFALLPGSAGSSWQQLTVQPSSLQGASVIPAAVDLGLSAF